MRSRQRLLAFAIFCALALSLAGQERKAAAAAAFQISGMVINATNNLPLAHTIVTINLAGGNFSRTVTTGDDGRFAFDRLRAGKYSLSAERRGFAAQAYEQHEGSFSTAIVVGGDINASSLIFRAWPDASFSGRVIDDRNEPVRNARVMLVHELMVEGRMGKRIVANTSTDDQGYYHFGHLTPGAYYIAVSARPWYAQSAFTPRSFREPYEGADVRPNEALDVAYPLTFYPDVSDATAARAINLEAGDRASADIILRAVPALHVRVRNGSDDGSRAESGGDRQFVQGQLSQSVFDGIEVPVQSMTRTIGGNVSMMTGVAPGHYLLRLTPNARRFRRMAAPAGEGPEQSEQEQPARVREVDLVSDTELDASEMPTAAVVSGMVTLANGQAPAEPPTIGLRRGAMRRTFNARANAKGEFAFPQGFAAGTYEVVMSSGDDLFIRSMTATGAKVAGRMLHISGSDAVKLNLVVSAGAGKIEGIAQHDGKPQSGAMILLVPDNPENNLPLFRRDQSDSDGSFTMSPVLPGRYTLLALEHGWDLQWGDAAVLKPFLANGETIVVDAKGHYKVRVKVQ